MGESSSACVAARRREFEQAVQDYGRSLAQLAYFICRDRHKAEDLVADALAKTWPRWRDNQVTDLSSYLRRAVINTAYKHERRRVVARHFQPQLGALLAENPPSDGISRRLDLIRAVLRLPTPQRAVIALRYLEDMTEPEIAETLGVSVGTVKSRTARGLAALRTTYGVPGG